MYPLVYFKTMLSLLMNMSYSLFLRILNFMDGLTHLINLDCHALPLVTLWAITVTYEQYVMRRQSLISNYWFASSTVTGRALHFTFQALTQNKPLQEVTQVAYVHRISLCDLSTLLGTEKLNISNFKTAISKF
jgi:hypothetical protein